MSPALLNWLLTVFAVSVGVGSALIALPALILWLGWRGGGTGSVTNGVLLGAVGLGVWLLACTSLIAVGSIAAFGLFGR